MFNKTKKVLHIRGMDEETSKEEVLKALTDKLGRGSENMLTVGELRQNQNETLAATVTVEKKMYEKLIANAKKKLKIG